jgi:hypothetical protein
MGSSENEGIHEGGNSSGKRSISMEFLKYLYINNWPHPL